MSDSFNPRSGMIIVRAKLFGPSGDMVLRLALDTGATATLINQSRLLRVGYDPSTVPNRVQVTTGSGVEFVTPIIVTRLQALGQVRSGFPVLCHTLPSSATIDGLLGLDFLRGLTLTIDFRSGQIDLT